MKNSQNFTKTLLLAFFEPDGFLVEVELGAAVGRVTAGLEGGGGKSLESPGWRSVARSLVSRLAPADTVESSMVTTVTWVASASLASAETKAGAAVEAEYGVAAAEGMLARGLILECTIPTARLEAANEPDASVSVLDS